jgi:DNA gyrase subunit B
VVQNQNTYVETDIQQLEGIDHVRQRPGMYVGGTDERALHHLVYEIVDNSVDEALAGHCDTVIVILNKDNSVTVEDNGRGIPVGIHPKTGTSALEVVMTSLFAGGKFDNKAYQVSGGLHGVGASAVNALSEAMEVEVRRDGKLYRQYYERGRRITPVEEVRDLEPWEGTGTKSTFRPDPTIMEATVFSYHTLIQRFREMSFVTGGIYLSVRDERVEPFPEEMTFYFEGGIQSFVYYLNRNRGTISDIIYANRDVAFDNEDPTKAFKIGVEVALQYTDVSTISILSFANIINTMDGGQHQSGMQAAITRTINNYARKASLLKDKEPNFSGNDTMEGLTAIVSIKHPDPKFESQTKVKLMNTEVQGAVSSVLGDVFMEYLETHSREAKRIIDKCMTSMRARDAAKKASELVRRGSNLLENTTLPGKLADCSNRNASETELYIVEGDSAGGSAKQGRDRHFQAILPLRGKILNTERARLNKILDNNEVLALVSALGVGIGEDFDVSRLRYHRVIIMTDADVDGAHIRTLLLTFFFRFMQSIITNGYLYIAQPPIYRLGQGKKADYYYSQAGERDADTLVRAMKDFTNPDKVHIQRYKGLGEMNPDQLWETTMNPASRVLLQVTIEDAAEAEKTFDMLMGSAVPPRKHFIQTHARSVRNLDI